MTTKIVLNKILQEKG